MNLEKIKDLINKYTKKNKRKKPWKNKLILSKMDQTTFIKKRKSIKINNFNFKKFSFFNKANYLLVIFVIIIASFFYAIIWTTFKVKFIEIVKQDNITNMTIAYKALDKYRTKSIVHIDKKDILKSLKDYQHNIKNISLKISLPNTLKIRIESYQALFNTIINNKTYLITQNWVLVPHVNSEKLKNINIIKSFDKNTFLDYKIFFNTEFINNISFIIKKVEENIIDLNIESIDYYATERELHIKTNNKTIIIFNLNSNIKEQIEKITIFNKEQQNINKSNIVYLDLRIKNKIFYCTTENEYQCYKNYKSVYLIK